MKTQTIPEIIREHSDVLHYHPCGDEAERIAALLRIYHDKASEALSKQKQFNDDLAVYLRALALVLDMTANASTHQEKNARLRGAIELIESAVEKVRGNGFDIAFATHGFAADVFRSDYPTRQFVQRIHTLEGKLGELLALIRSDVPAFEWEKLEPFDELLPKRPAAGP